MKKRFGILVGSMILGSVWLANFSAYASEEAELIKDIPTIQAFTDEAVSEDDIQNIVAAGVNAPSAMNGQPWHFSVITDKSVLEEIGGGMSFGKSGGMTPPDGAGKPEGMDMPEGFSAEDLPEGFSGEGMPGPGGFTGEGMPEGKERPDGAGKPEGFSGGNMPEGGDMPAAPASSGAKASVSDAPLVIVVSCKAGSELDAGLATQNMSAEAQLLGYGTKIVTSPTMTLNGERQEEFKELLGIPEDMSVASVLLIGKTDEAAYDAVSSATTRNSEDDLVTYIK